MSVTITVNKNHGGKREGAGRKKGSSYAENRTKHNFRLMVRSHSETALRAIVDTMNDPNHPERFVAAKLLVEYAYGRPGVMVIQPPVDSEKKNGK